MISDTCSFKYNWVLYGMRVQSKFKRKKLRKNPLESRKKTTYKRDLNWQVVFYSGARERKNENKSKMKCEKKSI